MWTYPKSALTPISCVQTVAYSIKNHKPWECKNLMQVSFKWLIEPHEIGVWHLQRAKTILYRWERKSTKTSTLRQLLSHRYLVYIIYIYIYTDILFIYWLVVPTPLKNISQIGSSSPICLGKINMFQTTNHIYIYTIWLFNIDMENHHV